MKTGEVWTIAAYGVGLLVWCVAARERDVNTQGTRWVALAALCGGVLGAKIVEWLLGVLPVIGSQSAGVLLDFSGGRTILGGVLGGWLAVEIAKKQLGIVRATGELFALAIPAGEAVGRIGCWFSGCCYGRVCEASWAVWQHEAWRYPTQFGASISAACLFGVLWFWRHRWTYSSDAWSAFLIGWGSLRFVGEFFREHAKPDSFSTSSPTLSAAQWLCLTLIGWGIYRWQRVRQPALSRTSL